MTSPSLTSATLANTRADLLRALGVLAEPPGPQHPGLASLLDLPAPSPEDWTEAFVIQLVPHASIYLGAEGMLGGEAGDRVAGFWRALRQPVPSDHDHLSALLGLYAALTEAEAAEPVGPRQVLRRRARAALLHEHLLSWLLAYTSAMCEVGPAAYVEWAELLRAALLAEIGEVGAPDSLPMQLRELPPTMAVDRLDVAMDALLTPARSGILLTRAHLGAVAQQGGLGLRLGDRRRILRALFEQDPAQTIDWLVGQADLWVARHRMDEALAGPIAGHWAARAAATVAWLRQARNELPQGEPGGNEKGV